MNLEGMIRRLLALVKKEFRQLLRDNSSILMGIFLPLVLIFIIGYGMSLDVEHVPLAVVLEDGSPTARRAVAFTEGSKYFSPVYVWSEQEAAAMMRRHDVDAILIVPPDFSSALYRGEGKVEVLLNGEEATIAMSAQRYLEAGMAQSLAVMGLAGVQGTATVVARMWFNDADTSTWFFVPGILMTVLTLSGVFLTAVVMAREWERGTFESLFVTPVRVGELIVAKMLPYFALAFLGMVLCLVAGRVLYDLPMRGSLVLILVISMIYLVVALGIGLVISAVTKSQFLACQVSLMVSFMPSVMLSGFLFDLHSQPVFIQFVSRVFPTTYYLEVMKTLFLSGNYAPLVIKNTVILLAYAVLFLALAFHMTRKKVEG